MTQAMDEINSLITARYRLIYTVTWEEQRLEQEIQELSDDKHNMDVFIWDYANGLQRLGADDDSENNRDLQDPEEVLEHIKNFDRKAIFILRDYHSFMDDAGPVRRLRNLATNMEDEYKPIIITSPTMKVPTELEKIMQVIDFSLPTPEQIGEQVDEAMEAIEEAIGAPEAWDENTWDGNKREQVIKACQGLTIDEVDNVLSKSWAEKQDLDINVILNEKKQIIRKSGVLEYYDNLEEFSNVGGMDLLKGWIRKRGNAFTDRAREFGLPQPKGMLLLGVQGCGKIMVCKSISGLWQMPMMRLDVGKIMQGVVGSSEENMRKAIHTAESISPAVLLIDEIEKGLSGTGSSNFSDGGTTSRVFSTFLQWMQDKESPVFVIATANSIKDLPPELLRKGRFDEIFFVSLPNKDERKEILDIHIRKKQRTSENFDLDRLADMTDGYSGAELEEAVTEGLYNAFDAEEELSTEHLEEAINCTVPLSETMKEQIEYIREWARYRARFASSNEREKVMKQGTNSSSEKGNNLKFRIIGD